MPHIACPSLFRVIMWIFLVVYVLHYVPHSVLHRSFYFFFHSSFKFPTFSTTNLFVKQTKRKAENLKVFSFFNSTCVDWIPNAEGSSPNYCVNSPLIDNMDLMTWRMVGKTGKSPCRSPSRTNDHVVKEQACQGAFAAYPHFAPVFHVLLDTA